MVESVNLSSNLYSTSCLTSKVSSRVYSGPGNNKLRQEGVRDNAKVAVLRGVTSLKNFLHLRELAPNCKNGHLELILQNSKPTHEHQPLKLTLLGWNCVDQPPNDNCLHIL